MKRYLGIKLPVVPSKKHSPHYAQVDLRVSSAQTWQGDVHLGIFIPIHTPDRPQKEMSQRLTEFAYKENPASNSAE